jgi:ABC-type multidrug transport system fused ATPase/permease subunit
MPMRLPYLERWTEEGNIRLENENQDINLVKTYLRVFGYAAKAKGLFSFVLLLTFAATIISLAVPYIFKLIFDVIQKSLAGGGGAVFLTSIIRLAFFYLILSIFQTIVVTLNEYFVEKWFLVVDIKIFTELYAHVSTLSMSFFENNPSGKIRERIYDGSTSITRIIQNTFINILPQLLLIMAVIFILFRVNIYFGIIVAVSAPIYFAVSWFNRKKLRVMQKETRERWESLSNFFNEGIINMRTVKTFAKEKYHTNQVFRKITSTVDKTLERSRLMAYINTSRGSLMDLTGFLILALGAYWTSTGLITLGTLVLVWQYKSLALEPIVRLAKNIDSIQKDLVSAALSFRYLDTKPMVEDSNDAKPLKIKTGAIEFKNVSFTYKSRKVISDFSLSVPGGKTVALVGRSGSGKSTLVKLLLRFYDLDTGSIFIDEQNIARLKQKDLRENIAVVMQDTVLFNNTAYSNIEYANLKAKEKDVISAAKASHSYDFIQRLPEKFQTIVGEKGVKLSGGEAQRVSIARAILKDSPILVLDEATSSLDSESEQLIQDAIWKLAKGRTTIIIAHRLSTVMKADLIAVMDKGKITEIGTHKDLVAKKGIYSRLYDIQSGGYLK